MNHNLPPIVSWLTALGITGWPLVTVIAIAAIVGCLALIALAWLVYFFCLFGDSALELGGELLKSIVQALQAELRRSVHNPAIQLERFLLIFLFLLFLACVVLWFVFELEKIKGATSLKDLSVSVFLVIIIAAIVSGSFAKYLLE